MEPLEDTDGYSCEHCGYSGRVGQFRMPGKGGPNFVCPRCYFSSQTYHQYLEEKYRSEAGLPSWRSNQKLSPELFAEYAKVERRIQARRASATQNSGGGCLLVIVGIPVAVLTLLAAT